MVSGPNMLTRKASIFLIKKLYLTLKPLFGLDGCYYRAAVAHNRYKPPLKSREARQRLLGPNMDQIIIGRHQTLDYLSSLWQASQIAPCHHCTINWVLVHTISQVYRVIVHYAGAKVLITSLIGFALGPFSVINHFGFLEVIKHVLKFVASQCLRCNVKCFVGGYPDRPYNEESHIVVCSRQHCRLTICIELVELTNIRWQDPNNNTDTETKCLV